MKRLEKLFFGIPMTWLRVILFAVIAGVYTGIVMQIGALKETSFQDIGISFEWWVLFAVVIAMNCEKPLESACKIFVFFLISQPLVYLTMWPEYHRFPWEYYAFWGKMTVLTLPGGYIAWFVKKKNLLSALILSVACALLAWHIVYYLQAAFTSFPHHLLSALVCFAEIVVFILVLLPGKRERLVVAIISLAVVLAVGGTKLLSKPDTCFGYPIDNAEDYTYTVEDETLFDMIVKEDGIEIHARKYGETVLTAVGEDGSVLTFDVTIARNGYVDVVER